MYQDLAILALFILVYSSVAGRVERTWVSGPIVFTIFGLLIGPVGLDLISFKADKEALSTLAELTLAMVLFTDAAGADMGVLRKAKALPIRLLLIGLPLTILLGFGVGVLLVEKLSLFEVALLATMLAPTDAALGKAVVTNEAVPDPVRQGLNVESGLNDGICVPILFVFLALATGKGGEGGPWKLAMMLVAEEIGIGLAVGLLLTTMAGWLLKFAKGQGWLTHTWIQIPVVALALGCFAVAQFLGGSGFIAAFSRRSSVRRTGKAAPGRVSARGGGHRGHPGADHLGDLRLGSCGSGGGSVQLAYSALCGAEPHPHPHVAGVSRAHRFGDEHRGQAFCGLVRSTWFGQHCLRRYRGER